MAYVSSRARLSLLAMFVAALGCLSFASAELPEIRVMSSGSMDNFWGSFRSVERGLGTRNRWTYFSYPDPMDVREEQLALHVLAGVTTFRIEGANGTEDTNGWFFPNTVVPAVAAAKYVSQVFANLDDQETVEEDEGEELKEWACDLDWEQPDPLDAGSSVFGADDGYCSTQCELVLFKVRSPSQGKKAIQQFTGDDLQENRFSNIMVACTFASARYYCAAIFADVLDADCGSCCSPDACSR